MLETAESFHGVETLHQLPPYCTYKYYTHKEVAVRALRVLCNLYAAATVAGTYKKKKKKKKNRMDIVSLLIAGGCVGVLHIGRCIYTYTYMYIHTHGTFSQP